MQYTAELIKSLVHSPLNTIMQYTAELIKSLVHSSLNDTISSVCVLQNTEELIKSLGVGVP